MPSSSTFPDWTSLFAAPSHCECNDCNSVFSPASYLVDIMQYLDKCPSNNGSGDSVLQVLLKRRPDIGDLLLTCENTKTEIPYIDLVNEIMEYYVVRYDQASKNLPAPTIPPDPALARDTDLATAEQLKAEPRYILLDAYKKVYSRVYPFNLPYHQPLDVIRTYLNFIKTSRAELLETFGELPTITPVPHPAIDAERLQLSLTEYEILTGNDFSGASAPQPTPNVVDYFGNLASIQPDFGIPASDLLQQTGLAYTDLLAILETKFINPGQGALNVLQILLSQATPPIQAQTLYHELTGNTWQTDSAFTNVLAADQITNPAFQQWLTDTFHQFQTVVTLYSSESECDLSKTFLYSIQCLYETSPGTSSGPIADANITATFLSQLHRFIRLWRKSGWTIHELDNIIDVLRETAVADITPDLIHKLGVVKKISSVLDLPLLELACLWGNIDSYGDNSQTLSTPSLYAQLFLSNTGTPTPSGPAQPNIFASNPLGVLFTSTPVPQLADHLPEIFAALGISADDYAAMVADADLATGNLSLANLSTLYRYKLLSTALDIGIPDLCILKSCLGVDPFNGPDTSWVFLQEFEKFQRSGFGVDVLNYVLTGSSKAIDDIAITQQAILDVMPTLQKNLSQIDSNNPNPGADPNIQAKVKQLKTAQIVSSLASLTGLDALTISALIAPDIDTLILDLSTTAAYPDPKITDFVNRTIRYHRAAQCITGFRLSSGEVSYLISNAADFGDISFLPVTTVQWLRLCDYTELRKIIPGKLLLPIFQQAVAEDSANPGALPSDSLISAVADANQPGWNKDFVSYLGGNQNTSTPSYFQYKVSDFRNEASLLQIKRAMDLAIKTQMPVNATGLPSWTLIETDSATAVDTLHPVAEQIKSAVKGKYPDQWLTIATQLNNTIRENQKQALISYLLTLQLPRPDGTGFVEDANDLYEYLLLDVQMTSVVGTSRLIQATMAVQLFADRCLLGLESQVTHDSQGTPAIDPGEWDWMKHYSVSAGLKKLFVYVENYLDPSLRDDKSSFFVDFESAIRKNDITAENMENAFRDYLHKLAEVSNMEVCGVYHEPPTAGATSKMQSVAQTLHVFARTHSAPYNYYYRTASIPGAQEDSWTWFPWEEVQLDIKSIDDGDNSGVHLVPVVWKKRLFLFWPELTEKSDPNTRNSDTFQDLGANASPDDLAPKKYWEVRLAWSEYANGKWTPKQLSKEILKAKIGVSTDPKDYLLNSTVDNSGLRLTLEYHGSVLVFTPGIGTFELTDIHEKISTGSAGIASGRSKRPRSVNANLFYESLKDDGNLALGGSNILNAVVSHRLIFSNDLTVKNISDFESPITNPFFFTDRVHNRTYFVTPTPPIQVRKPIFSVPKPLANFTIPATTRLQMFNAGTSPIAIVPSPSRATVSDSIERSNAKTLGKVAVSPNREESRVLIARLQPAPALNNFNAAAAKRLTIWEVTARETSSYARDTAAYRPSFLGEADTYLIPSVLRVDDGLAFYTFYHPFASIFVKKLNQGGVSALLSADTAEFMHGNNQLNIDSDPIRAANDQGSTFQTYQPTSYVTPFVPPTGPPNYYSTKNYYLENVDFSIHGTYSSYNWELFFHAPFIIATSLSKNGKYAEARQWFHYIFDPTSTEPATANNNSPFWQVLPFKTAADIEIQKLIEGLHSDPNSQASDNLNSQIDDWRNSPFNPFVIARLRPVAFMKNVVMAYLDNLISWGDDLFRTYTRENINEATQLYVVAARILGPAPEYIPERGAISNYSYNGLKATATHLDEFGDALVDLENAFPNSSAVQQVANSVPQNLLGIGSSLYFCIPPNDNLLQYWQKVGDRLFKIRHGQNIDGLFVPLALYQPPIDPRLLLEAHAQGLDVAAILADLESPAPIYRYSYLIQKAKEFCGEVVSFGSALLSANEKQDAEELSRLRQTQEIDLLKMVTEVKSRQVLEAQANLDNLSASRITALQRLSHYVEQLLGNQPAQVPDSPQLNDDLDENTNLPVGTIINQITSAVNVTLAGTDESGVKVIPKEKQEMDDSDHAYDWQLGASSGEALAGILNLFPVVDGHIQPLGVGAGTSFGGPNLGAAASALARVAQIVSSGYSHAAGQASRMAGFIRREQDWVFQANMTAREIIQLDKQIIAAQIRLQMAEHELENHQQQIENAQEIEQFLESKFSKQELYQWMIDKLRDIHKQGYQLAYDLAKKAESAYRFELGIPDTNFVQYGYYSDSYLGITAGEQLQLALKQMESSYLENNVREFELTKHISLKQVSPLALLQLIKTGTCQFDLAEALFDMDYPGHYFRRIKSIGITIPCVAGPYTTVNSTLRLQKNWIRTNTTGSYPIQTGNPANDDRFVTNNPPFMAIATSSAQNDSGVFELNFRDERYLPFEGAGAVSTWQLELNGKFKNNGGVTDLSQFDYDSITDVVIHIRYTAREEAGNFRNAAISTLPPKSLTQLLSLRHDFPSQWQAFLNQPDPNAGDQTCEMPILSDRMPYFLSKSNPKITNIALYAETAVQLPAFRVTSPGAIANTGYSFGPDPSVGTLAASNPSGQSWGDNNLGVWKIVKPGKPVLSAADIQDLYCLITYAV